MDKTSCRVGGNFGTKVAVVAVHKDGSSEAVKADDKDLTVTVPEIPQTLTAEEVITLARGGRVTRPVTVGYRGKTVEKEMDVEPVIYKASGINGRIYRRGLSSYPFIFSSEADIDKFLDVVLIDGKPVNGYGVSRGSTVIALNSDLMNSLEAGEHTIAILSNDGYAVSSFRVTDAETAAAEDVQNGSTAGGEVAASVRTADNATDKAASGVQEGKSGKTVIVRTGDSSKIGIAALKGMIAMIILAAMLFRRRKEAMK
jgi:hypothetical protein